MIAKKVGVKAGRVVLGKFANNETNVQLQEQVRGQDVYIIQTGEETDQDKDDCNQEHLRSCTLQ